MDWKERFSPIIAEIEAAAYERGWSDCAQSIMNAARHPPKPVQTAMSFAPARGLSEIEEDEPVIEIVHRYVQENPGKRGNAIVDYVAGHRPDRDRKLVDRTVRTALMRLKNREKILAVDNGWYPAEMMEATKR